MDQSEDLPGKSTENQPRKTPGDLEELARRYVDLWQDQMTALAADPDFAGALQKVMATMGAGASGLPAMWSAWPAALTGLMAAAQPSAQATAQARQADEGQESHGKPGLEPQAGPQSDAGPRRPAATARPAPAAAASDGGGPDLGRLEERLAALEQRLGSLEGALEGRTGGKGGGAKARAKRR